MDLNEVISNAQDAANKDGYDYVVYRTVNGLAFTRKSEYKRDWQKKKKIMEVTPVKGTMYFKDEGGYYAYKLTKDGKVADPNEMYEYGSLIEMSCTSMRMAKLIAKGRNLTAVFG